MCRYWYRQQGVTNLRTSRSDPESDFGALDYWQLFQDLPDPYLLFEVTSPEYRIIELNKARERLLGITRRQAIGKPLLKVHPPLGHWYHGQPHGRAEKAIRRVLRTRQPQTLAALRYDMQDKDGKVRPRYWQSSYIPLSFDAKNTKKITHILAITKEVTEEHAATSRMLRTEERLEAALAIGKVGSWLWDLDTNVIVADTTMAKMFGVRPGAAAKGLPQPQFTGTIHKDDLARVNAALQKAIKERSLFEEEYRTIDNKGRLHWVIARGRVQGQDGGHLTFPGVLMDITERRNLQAEVELAREQDRLNRQAARILQQRNEELEAISRTKDEFVALASHQLRTPATAVKQYIGMVLQGYVGEITEVQADMLAKAFESNERQIQIINQILNAARADTGRLTMLPVPLDLSRLVSNIAGDMEGAVQQRRHTLVVRVPGRPLMAAADSGYLRMAIENILHNAVVYTPDGGTITVRLSRAGKRAVLRISDTGVGIKKADLQKLFVKFSRIHNPLSVQAGGSGIGLYLAAEIVRLHKGTVEVESKPGKGTTFAISLPLVQNEPKKAQRRR